MMRKFVTAAAVMTVLALGAQAWAQCGAKATQTAGGEAKAGCAAHKSDTTKMVSGEGCDPAKCASKCGDKMACCPKLQYRVSGETLNCPKNAETLAKATNSEVKYVVGNKEFTDQNEAMGTLATLLEERLAQFTTVSYAVGDETVTCPMTAAKMASDKHCNMKYRVAAFTFDSKDKAEQAAQKAREAAEHVQMKTVVDGKVYTCQKETSAACQKSGKQAEFVVGENKTCCEKTAKVQLATAKIEAAMKALENTQGA